jgi:integrase
MKNHKHIHVRVYRRTYKGAEAQTFHARIRVKAEGRIETRRFSTDRTEEGEAFVYATKEAERLHAEMMAAAYGLTKEQKIIAATSLDALADEYIASMTGKPTYIAYTRTQILAITQAIPATQISHLADADAVRRAMEKLAAEREWGHRTWNSWRQSGSGFCAWLQRFKGLTKNPFDLLDTRDVRDDPRHRRRPWTLFEFAQVLAQAEKAQDMHSQCLFVLALFTGWRASTVRQIGTDDITLRDDGLVVSVPARAVKDKEARVATITDPTAVKIIRAHLATIHIGRNLFHVDVSHTSEITKHYMELARAQWVTSAETAKERGERERSDTLRYENRRHEFADFGALRMTWNHLQRLAGTDLRVRQELLGHSDPKLTSLTYDRVESQETQAAAKASANWLTPADLTKPTAPAVPSLDFQKMKALRASRGLTPAQAAERAELPAWAKLEEGAMVNVDLVTLGKISAALGVSPLDLILLTPAAPALKLA